MVIYWRDTRMYRHFLWHVQIAVTTLSNFKKKTFGTILEFLYHPSHLIILRISESIQKHRTRVKDLLPESLHSCKNEEEGLRIWERSSLRESGHRTCSHINSWWEINKVGARDKEPHLHQFILDGGNSAWNQMNWAGKKSSTFSWGQEIVTKA